MALRTGIEPASTESESVTLSIRPPKHIAITSNSASSVPGKCRLVVYDTANYKNIPDGGFFGKCKFITDGNTYTGTDYVGDDTETFEFVTIE